ncbi:MAG: DUF4136 domain-containing protein [Gemmatimonadales bacterium]|nr:DUF4136 domain-containing protein [Gemmatimonadales bacterium]
MKSGVFARSLAAVALAGLTAGCVYGFRGGGLPGHIRTVAVLPFDNRTGEPALTQEVFQAIRDAVERRLGLRAAPEAGADAVVRGEIVRYDPDIPLSYQSEQAVGRPGRRVEVTSRRVQITVNVEIFDQRLGRALWQRNGLSVDGEYQPPREIEGRRTALAKLVADVVEGAQSQW